MENALIASVAVNQTAFHFDKPYDYLVPESLVKQAQIGCRVTVPFGSANRRRVGIILSISPLSEDAGRLKSILDVIDSKPILGEEMLKLAEYMHETTFCTYFDAVKAMLPAGITHKMSVVYEKGENSDVSALGGEELCIAKYVIELGKPVTATKVEEQMGLEDAVGILDSLCKKDILKKEDVAVRRMGDASVKMVRLTDPDLNPSDIKMTPKQRTVVQLLSEVGFASVKEICYFAGVTTAVINALENKGIAELYEEEALHNQYTESEGEMTPIVLTEEQQTQYLRLKEAAEGDKSTTALLFGVTGSGKTQVFLKLVDDTVNKGEGVIVLVPEIALTPQTLAIFNQRYGDKVAVFHSAMPMGRRMDEWKRVKNGDAKIAIGTRSAIFAPMGKIGLIVMDEEQEHTYKSEQSPRYHARDIARFRAGYHSALLLLASATPSMESYSLALNGKYMLCPLKKRYGKALLPDVVTVDMREELKNGNSGAISRYLKDQIQKTLDQGNQAIILLNRRGHNTYVSCPSCGYVEECDNCSISMTYHSANGRMVCHYCGNTKPVPKECPHCKNSHMKFLGAGTQRVEEELNALFPGVGVLRMDSDSTMTRGAYESGFKKFADGEYGIMLGTQMVAKGLDFSRVTLVGVLNASGAAYADDYRGFERAFSLLTQVVGRSGRGDAHGMAVIQTNDPEMKLIGLAQKQDYEAFYETEILTRRLMSYPPYSSMVMLGVVSADRKKAISRSEGLLNALKELAEGEYKDVKMVILGPSAASVPRIGGKYRYRLLIKCRMNARFREMVRKAIEIENKRTPLNGVTVFVDVNPETIL